MKSTLVVSLPSTSSRNSLWTYIPHLPRCLLRSLPSSEVSTATLILRILGSRSAKSFSLDKLTSRDYTANHVPYVIMRSFPAILGLALIPISFLTLIALRLSLATAILGALLITFENALIAQSRLILLDSFLLFFTGLTMYFWVKFANLDSDGAAFTRKWWINLTLTGLGLGAVVSCKWVGLFTIAAVGMGTLRQLWLLLGNLKVTPKMWIKHFAARGLCLIVVPGVFYMFMFQIHFWILTRSGDGDGFMSSEFQHTLDGHGMADTYAGKLIGPHHLERA